MLQRIFLLFFGIVSMVHASDRSSTDYTVQSDSVNAGGGASASADYSHHGSLGVLPVEQSSTDGLNKNGHMARIYDVTGTVLELDPPEVNEIETVTAEMRNTVDDGTRLRLDPADYSWTPVSGPVTVWSTGLVAGQAVYEDTAAVIKTTQGLDSWTLNLTVRDVLPDNFGSYSGDGLPDDWQEQYFGLDNPNAAPDQDPDEDGQDNAFEETAGLNPTSAASRFLFWTEPDPATPGGLLLKFSPRFGDRTYLPRMTADLTGTPVWGDLPGTAVTEDDGEERTVRLPADTDGPRFFRVQIE